ncbi:hypothetical protein Y032_0032g2518 [Ancylostoma ceylanicum]|uniref:Uncharacterized protein n=1 Tax=Ancylostoma ceylanicum TaxID=53326 RepID=A0A016UPG9_9BILA|nr:hypothetical protein Y032_0032g2518 [Ancylostoma ceylanicum]
MRGASLVTGLINAGHFTFILHEFAHCTRKKKKEAGKLDVTWPETVPHMLSSSNGNLTSHDTFILLFYFCKMFGE